MHKLHQNTGIHTFELQCRLCYGEYLSIRERLYALSKETSSRLFRSGKHYKCEIFSNHGISAFLNAHYIKLIINPSRLTEPGNFIDLYSAEQCDASPAGLPHMLSQYLGAFLPAEICQRLCISRIDYTIDSFLPSDGHVLLMIKLAKKNGLPRGFEETYPAKIRNSQNFNNSFSYDISHTSGEYQITLYAKHKQLFTRKDIPQDMLSSTEGLLRAEISWFCPPSAIPFWHNEELGDFLGSGRLLSIYQNVVPRLFPYGVYLKSPLVKEFIEKSYKNQRTMKKHLLGLLDNIITYHSFHNGYKLLKNKNIPKKALLESFYSVGINPVTIGINEKIPCLPSLYSLLGLQNPYQESEKNLLARLEKQNFLNYD
ncbi:hypothetical protein D3Z36_16050 [Lachnospiraceae bacterium]|nr:hypothetical protein [Lachnospiraceae bacterium]